MKICKGKTKELGHCLNCHKRNEDGSVPYLEVYEIELGEEGNSSSSTFRLCPECLRKLVFLSTMQIKA